MAFIRKPATFAHRKRNLITVFLALLVKTASGQTFDGNGHFKPVHGNNRLYNPGNLSGTPNLRAPKGIPDLDQHSGQAQLTKEYKQRLLKKIRQTLYNIQDESLGLQQMYQRIWGIGFYHQYVHDLKALQASLEAVPDATAPESKWLPGEQTFDFWRKQPVLSVQKDVELTTFNQLGFDLIKKDAYAEWLRTTLLTDAAQDRFMNSLQINNDYINEWRKLEYWLTQIKEAKAWVEKSSGAVFTYDLDVCKAFDANMRRIDINRSPLVTGIKGSDFLRKWLWYSDGFPMMNPFLVTSKEKRYPDAETNTYFTKEKRLLLDSLSKAGALEHLGRTSKYLNVLLLPTRGPTNKDSVYLAEFDAADHYRPLNPIPDNALDRKTKLSIAIYNVPAEKSVSVNTTEEKLPYESEAITMLNGIADQIGVVTAIGVSNIGLFNKLTGRLQVPDLKRVSLNFNASLITGANPPDQNSYFQQKEKRENSFPGFPRDETVREAMINGKYVPLTGNDLNEDKRRLLLAGLLDSGEVLSQGHSPFLLKLVTEFVRRDRYMFLNYSSPDTFKQGLSALKKRFSNFRNIVNYRIGELQKLNFLIAEKFRELDPYIRISNRSLPPDKIAATIDTVPVLRTVLKTPVTPQAPKTLILSITEKAANGKGIPKEVISQSVNIISTQRFDFSLGLGYTSPTYHITSDGNPLPTSALGDHFQFQGGLHWYFVHRLNKLHDELGKHTNERFSLYAGLSIAHALDNIFTGLSYDVVPGIRLVGGCHFYKNYRFKIQNNTIADKSSGFSTAGFFMSFNLEPVTIGKAIGLFK